LKQIISLLALATLLTACSSKPSVSELQDQLKKNMYPTCSFIDFKNFNKKDGDKIDDKNYKLNASFEIAILKDFSLGAEFERLKAGGTPDGCSLNEMVKLQIDLQGFAPGKMDFKKGETYLVPNFTAKFHKTENGWALQ
jgi:hypothetical protein